MQTSAKKRVKTKISVTCRVWRRRPYNQLVLVWTPQYRRVMELVGKHIHSGGHVSVKHTINVDTICVGLPYDSMTVTFL